MPYRDWPQEDKDALVKDVWAGVAGEKRAEAAARGEAPGTGFNIPGRLALDDMPSDFEALKIAVGTVQKLIEALDA